MVPQFFPCLRPSSCLWSANLCFELDSFIAITFVMCNFQDYSALRNSFFHCYWFLSVLSSRCWMRRFEGFDLLLSLLLRSVYLKTVKLEHAIFEAPALMWTSDLDPGDWTDLNELAAIHVWYHHFHRFHCDDWFRICQSHPILGKYNYWWYLFVFRCLWFISNMHFFQPTWFLMYFWSPNARHWHPRNCESSWSAAMTSYTCWSESLQPWSYTNSSSVYSTSSSNSCFENPCPWKKMIGFQILALSVMYLSPGGW